MFIEQLPVPKISESEQQPLIDLVENILSMRKANQEADVLALEAEIDELVYKLYDLTLDEIAIVEGK